MDLDNEEPAVSEEEVFEPQGPRPIKKLSNDVINQIAAAEIIHRPSNAIKELIENSLDAGSTSIKVTIKEGGLKLIQITDNGHGIHKSDLPLLCTRYATSKLVEFEDLQRIGTYGFRGEALASISYCSHVEVITKTKEDSCGWRANYSDGVLVSPKPGSAAEPRPAAANDGTVISAEDLFYNMPLRKRAFKSPSEEYNRILDVIQKYAIHNPHAAWICKKAGTALPDISTPPASTSRANIGLLYTSSLANDLLEVPETVLRPTKLGAKIRGWVSNANTNWSRRGGWLFFINNRLVDSSKIKKAIDSVYTTYLPKGASPWIYLSLEIEPSKVDVNVHPTKSDVHFLHEDEMIEGVVAAVQAVLSNSNTSRTFNVQTLLPGVPEPSEKRGEPSAAPAARKPAPNYKVRMDPSNRTLESMLAPNDPSQLVAFSQAVSAGERPPKRRGVDEDEPIELSDEEGIEGDNGGGMDGRVWDAPRTEPAGKEIPESMCEFTSIKELRRECKKKGNLDMAEIMTRHAFVGIADRDMCLALIQHRTKLYLVNYASLSDEHFYQLGLRQFGALHKIRLDPPPSLLELLELATQYERGIQANGLTEKDVAQDIYKILMDKKEMIDEYFSLGITENGLIETLPMLLPRYSPNLDRLPHFLLCLGTQVDWEDEKKCFQTFLRELAFFYSPRPFSDVPSGEDDEMEDEIEHQDWQLKHVLFPSFRRYTSWSKELHKDVNQVANLPDLFRVFERC